MKTERKVSTCKHCGKSIMQYDGYDGRLWHDTAAVIYPAYCTSNNTPTAEPIHEPLESTIPGQPHPICNYCKVPIVQRGKSWVTAYGRDKGSLTCLSFNDEREVIEYFNIRRHDLFVDHVKLLLVM